VTARADLPPLPPLEWEADSAYWSADGVALPSLWAAPIWVAVWSPDPEQSELAGPSPAQRAAVAHLAADGGAARVAALDAIRPRARRFGAVTAAELAGRLRLTAVYVGSEERDGTAYVGLEFHCDEYEHGIGVVLHRSRVVRVGVADDAMNVVGADEDA
jgi:hypothetical protein